MPRFVRNFWIETETDARSKPVGTGPTTKDGGFTTLIYYRNEGSVSGPVRIDGKCLSSGELVLLIEHDGKEVARLHLGKRD